MKRREILKAALVAPFYKTLKPKTIKKKHKFKEPDWGKLVCNKGFDAYVASIIATISEFMPDYCVWTKPWGKAGPSGDASYNVHINGDWLFSVSEYSFKRSSIIERRQRVQIEWINTLWFHQDMGAIRLRLMRDLTGKPDYQFPED